MTGFTDDYLNTVLDKIHTHKVMIQGVFPTQDDPDTIGFSYTVGLSAHDHPELIIFGLPMRMAQTLLNDLAFRVIDKNARFHAGQEIHDLIRDYPARLVEVADSTEHLTIANRIYTAPVAALQVLYPDAEGRWPWDENSGVALEPVLGEWRPA